MNSPEVYGTPEGPEPEIPANPFKPDPPTTRAQRKIAERNARAATREIQKLRAKQAKAEGWCCEGMHLHIAAPDFAIIGNGTPEAPDAKGALSLCCQCRKATVVYTIMAPRTVGPENCGPGIRVEYNVPESRKAPGKITPNGDVVTPSGLVVPGGGPLVVPGR